MATDHLKKTYEGLVATIENAPELDGKLRGVFPYYAYGWTGYSVMPRQMTISVLVGDTDSEVPIHNETTQTDILPTDILLVVDTSIPNDKEMYISELGDSMLDMEYCLLRALQSESWWNAEGSHHGWIVSGIERDVPVQQADGNIDPDVRRLEVTLSVDVLFDRDDGPGR